MKECQKNNCKNPAIPRGKYCEDHRTKKYTKKEKCPIGEFFLTDLNTDVLSQIANFLTIYENLQLVNIIDDIPVNWEYLQNRDFPDFSIPLSKNNAVNLDNGNILSYEPFLPKSDIESEEIIRNKITKTVAMSDFHLSKEQIETIKPVEIRRNPYYRSSSPMQLYDILDIQKLSAKIHNGITNLKIYKTVLLFRKEQKESKKIDEHKVFIEWKLNLEKDARKEYSHLSSNDRKNLLDSAFKIHNLDRREDSSLCNGFISGNVVKSIGEICAIVYLTEILFSYNHAVYSENHEVIKEQMYKMKFKKPKLDWILIVDTLVKKYHSKFLRTANKLCFYDSDDY